MRALKIIGVLVLAPVMLAIYGITWFGVALAECPRELYLRFKRR